MMTLDHSQMVQMIREIMKPGDIVILNHLSKIEFQKIVSLQIDELGKKLSARKITITMANSMNEREFTIESGGQ